MLYVFMAEKWSFVKDVLASGFSSLLGYGREQGFIYVGVIDKGECCSLY